MVINNVGSICSGIEAASVAWKNLNMKFDWFSEIAEFPARLLKTKYPDVVNLGDMNDIPDLIKNNEITSTDLICGGTPCQAFSLAGWKNGLNDERGNLSLKFVDIVEENDNVRIKEGKKRAIVFWENVEGVLKDKTNAFGCLVSSLAGLDQVIEMKNWTAAGIVRGKKRNVAWRVLDAKYFGVPQQRKRLYLMAGDVDFYPENILFENGVQEKAKELKNDLVFSKDGHQYEVFRDYTDCLYSAYGTKWNGNAAAYNGSLFIVQDSRLRRLTPLECERLMGFPDNYTDLNGASLTQRYQAVGNSWAVPVVRWIGERLVNDSSKNSVIDDSNLNIKCLTQQVDGGIYLDCSNLDSVGINTNSKPLKVLYGNMKDIVSKDAPENLYISPVGCYGILRRRKERNLGINNRLENILEYTSSKMSVEEIEKKSLVQKRGRKNKE